MSRRRLLAVVGIGILIAASVATADLKKPVELTGSLAFQIQVGAAPKAGPTMMDTLRSIIP